MKPGTLLVVEDDFNLGQALKDTLELSGYVVDVVEDGGQAAAYLARKTPALVISDIQMPKVDGHSLLKLIKLKWPELPVMMMTAYGSIEKAVEAMRDGAVDYLTKPFEAEVLVNMVSRYMVQQNVDRGDMIALDPKSREILNVAKRVSKSDATVMILGESGSGKEVLARLIHKSSGRSAKPFIAINCAAIPDNMLEATLFGYEKGAFTGAYKASPGKFELAHEGTLLLDEISEMDLALQAKLLRVIQEKEVERLGSHKLIALNVRLLATTNRNLGEEVQSGRFREDLFYRLNVFPITVPPLRERKKDIIPLAELLITKHFSNSDSIVPRLDLEAKKALCDYYWPGNVRELDNVIQRAMILRQGERLTLDDLKFEQFGTTIVPSPAEDQADCVPNNLGDHVKNQEHRKIVSVMKEEMGNRQLVADRLGISQRTLRYKLAKMRDSGISIPSR